MAPRGLQGVLRGARPGRRMDQPCRSVRLSRGMAWLPAGRPDRWIADYRREVAKSKLAKLGNLQPVLTTGVAIAAVLLVAVPFMILAADARGGGFGGGSWRLWRWRSHSPRSIGGAPETKAPLRVGAYGAIGSARCTFETTKGGKSVYATPGRCSRNRCTSNVNPTRLCGDDHYVNWIRY